MRIRRTPSIVGVAREDDAVAASPLVDLPGTGKDGRTPELSALLVCCLDVDNSGARVGEVVEKRAKGLAERDGQLTLANGRDVLNALEKAAGDGGLSSRVERTLYGRFDRFRSQGRAVVKGDPRLEREGPGQSVVAGSGCARRARP